MSPFSHIVYVQLMKRLPRLDRQTELRSPTIRMSGMPAQTEILRSDVPRRVQKDNITTFA